MRVTLEEWTTTEPEAIIQPGLDLHDQVTITQVVFARPHPIPGPLPPEIKLPQADQAEVVGINILKSFT